LLAASTRRATLPTEWAIPDSTLAWSRRSYRFDGNKSPVLEWAILDSNQGPLPYQATGYSQPKPGFCTVLTTSGGSREGVDAAGVGAIRRGLGSRNVALPKG
jgi:hypothetical protein